MTSLTAPRPWASSTPNLAAWAAPALFAAAFLIRMPHFGDPAFLIDEQFYLLVGDRMLHGALPYVDIWDRKPIGLFLIYAAIRLLGGEGFVAYQMMATMFAAGTACCIFAIARRATGAPGAILSGLLYLLWLEIAEGGGGQSPVFYNLLVAGAALLTLEAIGREERRSFRIRAFAAMLLIGCAIQIKYTVLVEGLYFGLVLAWGTWRRRDGAAPALAEIALLALVALAPTLLAFAAYALMGQARAFWFANFTSIFLRAPSPPDALGYRATQALLRLVPLGTCALAACWHLHGSGGPHARRWLAFLLGWSGAALIGFFSIGVLYAHYLLPVFVPLAAAAAPIFARRPLGIVLGALAVWLPASHLDYPDFARTARSQRQIATLAALLPADVATGCLQMFDGPPILYLETHACTLSRFVFPDHLSAAIERDAIGVDPAVELRRILALRPRAITIGDRDVRPPNRETFAIVRAALARDYALAGSVPVDGRFIEVYLSRPPRG